MLFCPRNVADFGIYLGMVGKVEKVLIHQRLDISFFYDSRFSSPIIKSKLCSYPTFIIKNNDFVFSKKLNLLELNKNKKF
jgi:hypothetical protein